MPAKKKAPERAPSRIKFAFVRYELTEVELRQCKAWKPTSEDLDAALLPFTDRDYKFVIKYDNYNSCYQCTMMTDNKIDPNFNLGLVGRGSSPMKALKQVLWKDRSCDSVWPAPDFSEGKPAEFDD